MIRSSPRCRRWVGAVSLPLAIAMSTQASSSQVPLPADPATPERQAPFLGGDGLGGAAAERRVVVNGARLEVERAVLDPWGRIAVRARGPDGTLEFELETAPLPLPFEVERVVPAEPEVATDALRSYRIAWGGVSPPWTTAKLRWACTRAGHLSLRGNGERDGTAIEIEASIDLDVARLEAPAIAGEANPARGARDAGQHRILHPGDLGQQSTDSDFASSVGLASFR